MHPPRGRRRGRRRAPGIGMLLSTLAKTQMQAIARFKKVGLSFMTFNAPRAYEIADRFRLEMGKTVIMGGYHATFRPEEAIGHADAVCIGEAEPNLPRMVGDFRSGRLQPFYRGGLADLGSLLPLNRSLVPNGLYLWADTAQATRGCPQQCTFCSITAFFDHGFRARPVEHVTDELRSLGKRILFMDDNLTSSREYAKELFSAMIPLKKHWYSQCSVSLAEDDELHRLRLRRGYGRRVREDAGFPAGLSGRRAPGDHPDAVSRHAAVRHDGTGRQNHRPGLVALRLPPRRFRAAGDEPSRAAGRS